MEQIHRDKILPREIINNWRANNKLSKLFSFLFIKIFFNQLHHHMFSRIPTDNWRIDCNPHTLNAIFYFLSKHFIAIGLFSRFAFTLSFHLVSPVFFFYFRFSFLFLFFIFVLLVTLSFVASLMRALQIHILVFCIVLSFYSNMWNEKKKKKIIHIFGFTN